MRENRVLSRERRIYPRHLVPLDHFLAESSIPLHSAIWRTAKRTKATHTFSVPELRGSTVWMTSPLVLHTPWLFQAHLHNYGTQQGDRSSAVKNGLFAVHVFAPSRSIRKPPSRVLHSRRRYFPGSGIDLHCSRLRGCSNPPPRTLSPVITRRDAANTMRQANEYEDTKNTHMVTTSIDLWALR